MSMRRSEFGKCIAQIRIQRDLLLRDTAEDLGVSAAYLSNVEHGRKRVPDEWFEEICRLYGLSLPEAAALRVAVMRSNRSVEVKVDTPAQAKLLAAYEAKRECLDDKTATKIADLLKNASE